MQMSITPTDTVLVLTNADTQYSYLIPDGTVQIQFSIRSGNAARYSWVTGRVASPAATDPYITLAETTAYGNDQLSLTGKTLYFAASTAGEVVEIEIWRAV